MIYYLHNMTRDVTTRTQRYSSASHKGLILHVGGARIVRGRPAAFTEEMFIRHLSSIKKLKEAGQLAVRTASGREIDINTGEVAASPPAPPLPIVVLDSIANDKPSGNPMPIYPGGEVQLAAARTQMEQAPVEEADEDDGEDSEVEFADTGAATPKKRRRRNKSQ